MLWWAMKIANDDKSQSTRSWSCDWTWDPRTWDCALHSDARVNETPKTWPVSSPAAKLTAHTQAPAGGIPSQPPGRWGNRLRLCSSLHFCLLTYQVFRQTQQEWWKSWRGGVWHFLGDEPVISSIWCWAEKHNLQLNSKCFDQKFHLLRSCAPLIAGSVSFMISVIVASSVKHMVRGQTWDSRGSSPSCEMTVSIAEALLHF